MAGKSLVLVAAAICALAIPAAARAEVVTSPDSDPVTLNDSGNATPYPSEVKVIGADGPIVDVNVSLVLSHTYPDDLGFALVDPNGKSTILMSHVCSEGDLASAVIILDQDSANPLPNSTNCTSGGTFQPTVGTGVGTITWPAPGPGSITEADLDTFVGDDPNGQWRLFAIDAAAGQAGTLHHWSLTITTEAADIAIPAGPGTEGIAGPYPSVVDGQTPDGEVISRLDVAVNNLNHTFPGDIDMLLQGPGGQAVMLMSDACSDLDMHENEIRFSDLGDPLTVTSSVVDCEQRFVVRPTDFEDPESLPAPAPQRPYESSLAAFKGLQGGDWRLWIADDAGGDTGWLNGWTPVITSRPAATTGFTATAIPTAEGQTATLTVTRSGPVDLGPATLDVSVDPSGADLADIGTVPAKLQFARGETSKTIEVPINSDFDGEGAEDFVVSLTNPVNDARLTDATSFAVVTIAASPPDNRFKVGEVTRLRNGSATVEVTIPNPGTLATDDAGPKDLLKPIETDASKAGEQVVKVKPSKTTKRKLRRGKKVNLTAAITYTPYDGLANSADVAVKLKRA